MPIKYGIVKANNGNVVNVCDMLTEKVDALLTDTEVRLVGGHNIIAVQTSPGCYLYHATQAYVKHT
jgi:hypothetical protein